LSDLQNTSNRLFRADFGFSEHPLNGTRAALLLAARCLIRSRTQRGFAGGLRAVLAVSAALKVAQLSVASRFTSVEGTIGSAIALGFA
jgi:hypothetical protein